MHEQIWAPWRLSYIVTAKDDDRDGGCFICRYRDEDRDAENLVVSRSSHTISVLNRFPYNNGHLLVAPLSHVGSLDELNDDQLLDSMRALQRMTALYRKILTPDGFNVGLNLGKAAGAGLPGHLHWHLVPRWNGDTNFMPVLGDVNVIPQSLEALYKLIHSALAAES